MDRVIKQLNLGLNKEKTFCIAIGSKKQLNQVRAELEKEPLMCGNFETKLKERFKWLGQILSSGGLAESVAATVQSREGKIRGACLEIAKIVNDWRSKIVGGMDTALMLWEVCCVPSLLHGAGTWTEISSKTEKQVNQCQNWFLRLILQLGPGTPLPSLLWDTALLDMSIRIIMEKILLVLHLRSLPNNSLARKIYEEQKLKNWPGLARETEYICKEMNIPSCNEMDQSKSSYKKTVLEACHRQNEKYLRSQAKGKCERIGHEEYGRKQYILSKNISSVRKQFRTRFGLQFFAGSYSHDKRFRKSDWLCKCEESREDEAHLLSGQCTVYGDLTLKYSDLTSDDNLVGLFTEILARRDELDRVITPVGGGITNVGANPGQETGISHS
jgi:hypothetical protein